nr:formin-like protein 3 [Aegilops tauschii subsp. strangulata]
MPSPPNFAVQTLASFHLAPPDTIPQPPDASAAAAPANGGAPRHPAPASPPQPAEARPGPIWAQAPVPRALAPAPPPECASVAQRRLASSPPARPPRYLQPRRQSPPPPLGPRRFGVRARAPAPPRAPCPQPALPRSPHPAEPPLSPPHPDPASAGRIWTATVAPRRDRHRAPPPCLPVPIGIEGDAAALRSPAWASPRAGPRGSARLSFPSGPAARW